MAHLSVSSHILRYKETSYQISQMTSIKPGRVTRTRQIDYISLERLPIAILIGVVMVAVGSGLISDGKAVGLLLILAGSGTLFYCYRRWQNRRKQDQVDPRYLMYGLSIRMSNGDKEFFLSSDEVLIQEIHDNVVKAMDGIEGVSVTFENANIEISNSENVTIGSVNHGE